MSEPASARPPVRVAVVGLGWAGRSIWLPRLIAHPDFTVTAVVDSDPAARAAAAEQAPGAATLAWPTELTREQADLAVVAVPNHLHTEVGAELLTRGIPVFLEKPVCLSTAEAERLAAAERSGGSVLLAGSAARHRGDVRELCAVVGGLGRVRHIEVAWVRSRGIPRAGGWFTRRDLAGGGAMVDLGWHLLDTLVPLLGAARFVQITGTLSDDFLHDRRWAAAWREDQPADTGHRDVEDTARAFLVSDEGVSVALRASWASHQARDTTTITVEAAGGTATLRCTFGFSPNRQGGATLSVTRDGETTPVAIPHEEIGLEYVRQLDTLPAALADPLARGSAAAEAARTIAVIERFYESALEFRALAPTGR
ncbi:Gfo/Idh/MocA family oxidoreductase [Actinoplanes sp. NPDC048967]|uniref:Gfo/Idh/MocA family protein n=1 Tax=Actinoplanes sp. NPDC048967 TaxID=3155269 RepID=UPI0033C7640F